MVDSAIASRFGWPVLLSVRRADIESFARELEARGRARATVTRRLCTIAEAAKRSGPADQ
jgi:hypothetical protein